MTVAPDQPSSYLSFAADLDDPAAVSAYDEAPLWSAAFGLLLLEHVPLPRDGAVLDIGCGTGFPLLELAQRCGPAARAYGVDVWRAALHRAEAKRRMIGVARAAVIHADAVALPFAGDRFDLVVSNLGVNNFADPDAALREIARVLTPAGTVALTTNLRGHMAEFYAAFEQTLLALDDQPAIEVLRKHIDHRVTVESVTKMLVRAGLAVTRVVDDSAVMRFANGTALLHDYFIKLGFLDAWKEVVAPDCREATFAVLEENLNTEAATAGALELTIPMAYIEGRLAG
ncbi:MAG: class I SAM-dependent methyltransferase [Chloroflexota bacterium]|nr:class I SAM-dependent methyltransferase [Chloroflexota bacterium]